MKYTLLLVKIFQSMQLKEISFHHSQPCYLLASQLSTKQATNCISYRSEHAKRDTLSSVKNFLAIK